MVTQLSILHSLMPQPRLLLPLVLKPLILTLIFQLRQLLRRPHQLISFLRRQLLQRVLILLLLILLTIVAFLILPPQLFIIALIFQQLLWPLILISPITLGLLQPPLFLLRLMRLPPLPLFFLYRQQLIILLIQQHPHLQLLQQPMPLLQLMLLSILQQPFLQQLLLLLSLFLLFLITPTSLLTYLIFLDRIYLERLNSLLLEMQLKYKVHPRLLFSFLMVLSLLEQLSSLCCHKQFP